MGEIGEKVMVQAIGYHGAHKPYLGAVAEALSRDGLAVVEYDAAPDDPRHGWVVIGRESSSRRFGQHLLVLRWHEETGWARGTEDPDGHGELCNIYGTQLGLLPPPADVVTWVRAVLNGTDNDDVLRVRYRDFEDQGDRFEDALRDYWPPCDDH